jgi:N-acetyl-anhydromuramyl-L-alanine amidase AmpD
VREVKKIIVHCSDSEFGNAALIDSWHRERKWRCIGYHFVIENGRPSNAKEYYDFLDGAISSGRSISKSGSHTYRHNKDSVAICLIGKKIFTSRQQLKLYDLINTLLEMFPHADLDGHRDYEKKKTCPNFDVKSWYVDMKDHMRKYKSEYVTVKKKKSWMRSLKDKFRS